VLLWLTLSCQSSSCLTARVFLLPAASAAVRSRRNDNHDNYTGPCKTAIPKTLKDALKKLPGTLPRVARSHCRAGSGDLQTALAVRYEEMRKKNAASGLPTPPVSPPFPLPANNGEYRVPELAEFTDAAWCDCRGSRSSRRRR
jgi:hypothetical protein